MFKVAKEWILSLDLLFALTTGYSILEVIPLLYIFAFDDFNLNTLASLFAGVIATIYWCFRLSEWWALKKDRKIVEDLKKRNVEIQNELLENEIIKKEQEKKLREIEIQLLEKHQEELK